MPLHPVRVARDAAIERLDELDVVLGQLIDPQQISSLLNRFEAASPDELEELESEALLELSQMGVDEPIALQAIAVVRELNQVTHQRFELENELVLLDREFARTDKLQNKPPEIWVMHVCAGPARSRQPITGLDRRFGLNPKYR